MLTIWGRASSSNVMKLLWLCDELHIAYRREEAGGAFGRTRDDFYVAMNPNSTVPTVVEADGFSLWESNTILRYLGGALVPQDRRARADAERWMDWQLGSLNNPMSTLFLGHIRTPEDQRDWPALHAARDRAQALWAMVDKALEGRDFVAGGFGLADMALGPYLHRWFALPIERAPLPRLRAYYERLLARPAFATHCATEMN